jgi:hypothetical protein
MSKRQSEVDNVEFETEHLTFRSIWHAARVLREAGDRDESQGFWSLMAAALLAYTAYEGFVNDLLRRSFPETWADERRYFVGQRRGTLGKTNFLAEQLNIQLNRASRPWRTFAEVHAWRNDLVHPQTVRITGTTRADAYARKPRRAKPVVFAKLERPSFVTNCFDDLSTLADLLLDGARAKDRRSVRELGERAFSGVVGHSGASLQRRKIRTAG